MSDSKRHELKKKYHDLKQLCDNFEVLLGIKKKTVKLKRRKIKISYRTSIAFYSKKYESLLEQCYDVPIYLNNGEKEEIKCIKQMTVNKCINNFKFFNELFGASLESTDIVTIVNANDDNPITTLDSVKKAGSTCKHDITVKIDEKVFHISIKNVDSASPAIMNHTPRTAKIFTKGEHLFHILPVLDKIIARYIDKRNSKLIGEDVNVTKIISSTDEESAMISLLIYFVFHGTGSRLSKKSVNCVYEITKGNAIESNKLIICDTAETKRKYIEKLLPNCVMSLRSKGMPKKIKEYNIPWLFTKSGKNKGALHIRVRY